LNFGASSASWMTQAASHSSPLTNGDFRRDH
jgi:hypothetical protein